MVRIEPCATTVRSGHVVVRKKRRSSMARLKEAACSTSFCFFLPLLLLLLFCETLSSTGLKRQRERERKETFFRITFLRVSLSSKLPSKKLSSLGGRKNKSKLFSSYFFFLFLFFYVTIQAAKRLVNELATAIIIINRRILRVEIFAGIYTRRWMWVVVDGWPRVEGNLIFYLIGRMEEFIYPRGPFVGRQPFPFVIL